MRGTEERGCCCMQPTEKSAVPLAATATANAAAAEATKAAATE